jgi:hypothetical protein
MFVTDRSRDMYRIARNTSIVSLIGATVATVSFIIYIVLIALSLSGCAKFSMEKDGFKAKYISIGQNVTVKGITLAKVDDSNWTARLDEFGRDSGPGMSLLEKIGESAVKAAISGGTLARDDASGGTMDQHWYSLNLTQRQEVDYTPEAHFPEQIQPPRFSFRDVVIDEGEGR